MILLSSSTPSCSSVAAPESIWCSLCVLPTQPTRRHNQPLYIECSWKPLYIMWSWIQSVPCLAQQPLWNMGVVYTSCSKKFFLQNIDVYKQMPKALYMYRAHGTSLHTHCVLHSSLQFWKHLVFELSSTQSKALTGQLAVAYCYRTEHPPLWYGRTLNTHVTWFVASAPKVGHWTLL